MGGDWRETEIGCSWSCRSELEVPAEYTFSLWMCLALVSISVPNFLKVYFISMYMCVSVYPCPCPCVLCVCTARTRLCVSASRGQKRESEALSWKSLGTAGCGSGSGCRAVNSFCPLKSGQCSEAVLSPSPPLSLQFPEALNCSTLGEQTQYLQDVSHPSDSVPQALQITPSILAMVFT